MRYASRAITVLFLLLVVNWNADEFSSNEFRVALLPVGHGQCAVLEMPGGDKYVFDCGSSTFYDCGRRIAAPYLRSRRIRNITALIISHPHEDHVNGIDGLLEAVKTDSIYINADCQNKGFYGDVVEYEKAAVFDGKGRWMLEILPPLSEYESLNDRCLAVLINCGQMSILLPADIEKQRQTELINLGINADVLATPHHGSKVTSLNDLAEKMTVSGVISTADEDMFALKIITVK
jgi:competence protein ComEC